MTPKIALITIITADVPRLAAFYRDVLGFAVAMDRGRYVEFVSERVRFAICAGAVMAEATGQASFERPAQGHSFELAFPLDSPAAVDEAYARIVAAGAAPIKGPATMPWGQRTAFFADPDGHIHELFADLPE